MGRLEFELIGSTRVKKFGVDTLMVPSLMLEGRWVTRV